MSVAQAADELELSAGALAALAEFAGEAGLAVDPAAGDLREAVQAALQAEEGDRECDFAHRFDPPGVEIRLRGLRRDLGQTLESTGLTLWRAAEELCRYMCARPHEFAGRRALELGAGLGLTGILASALGADVVLTDGDGESLPALRANVAANACAGAVAHLRWGEALDAFRAEHGRFGLVMAADVIYEEASVRPLFETAAALLSSSDDDPPDPDARFVLAYTRRNVSISYVLEQAALVGLEGREAPGWEPAAEGEDVWWFTRSGSS